MAIGYWLLSYALNAVFWLWVLRWGGAERLEDSFMSGFLVSIFAPGWSAEGIKLFALLALIFSTIGFVVGLLAPSIRCWSAAC